MRIIFLVSSVSTFIAGCGSDEKSGGNASIAPPKQNQALYIAEGSDLPVCGADNEQQLVYSATDTKFKACQSGAWVDVVVKGERGEKGEKGDPGNEGQAGKNGTDNRIVKTVHCDGDLPGPDLAADYNFIQFASGDVFANASVGGTLLDVSGTSFYSAEQAGSVNGSVIFTYDVFGAQTSGWWWFAYSQDENKLTVTYNDAAIVNGGKDVWTLTECEVKTY